MELKAGQWWHPTSGRGGKREPRQVVWAGPRANAPKAMRHILYVDERTVGYRCKATPTFPETGHDSWMNESGFLSWIRRTKATVGPNPFEDTVENPSQPSTLYGQYCQAIDALKRIRDIGTRQESIRIGDAYTEQGWQDYTVQSDEAKLAEEALEAIGEPIRLTEQQAKILNTKVRKLVEST